MLFSDQGFDYTLQNEGGRTIHRETRRDRAGKVIASVEGQVRYVLGSGAHARSFLIERDDYLFQSPITWYAQEGRSATCPQLGNRVGRFERQISPACLTCHANEVDHVEGTEGRIGRRPFGAIRLAASDATVRESCMGRGPRRRLVRSRPS